MRILLGWLVLFGLFALAGVLHGAWRERLRQERDQHYAAVGAQASGDFATSGEARLLIGRPSGAEPLDVAPRVPRPPSAPPHLSAEVETPVWAEKEAPPDWSPPVYELTVQAGQVLSKLCEEFYGTGRPPIPDLVATYNGLPDADSVRAGQKLLLPPIEVLRSSSP